MLRGIAIYRWVQWIWMAVVAVLVHDEMEHPAGAWVMLAVALVATVAIGAAVRRQPDALLRPAPVAGEAVIAAALNCAGGAIYRDDPFAGTHVLGASWPMAVAFTAGIGFGPYVGAAVGAGVGSARILQPVFNGVSLFDLEAKHFYSLVSTLILHILVGAVSGYITRLLVRAEREVAAARAREEVSRTLHDGVLQTLAIIERRADDPALARMAREQERDLRSFLFGSGRTAERGGAADVGPALRQIAARFEDVYGGRADVILAPDLPHLPDTLREAIVGATTEAVTNAGKHGRAGRVTIYIEPDDGEVVCSVRDDGAGFDAGQVSEGVGLSRSIRGRLSDIGGRVEIESRVGSGTEIRMFAPIGPP